MPGETILIVESCADSPFDSGKAPACPVILIGDSSAAAPHWADAIVPDRAAANRIEAQVAVSPNAARVIVGLLRILPKVSLADGLVMESLAYGLLQGSGEFDAWLTAREPVAALGEPGQVRADRRGNALHIELHRPGADNAIDRPMRDGLAEMLELAVMDQTIERVILTGAGRSFSLGAELSEFGTTRDPATAHAIRMVTLPAHAIIGCADRLDVHVQGACVGSALEMAAFATRLTASPSAWFHLPELAMGIIPGAGGCVSVSRRIGRQRVALMILSGRRISAATAFDWGLIDALMDD